MYLHILRCFLVVFSNLLFRVVALAIVTSGGQGLRDTNPCSYCKEPSVYPFLGHGTWKSSVAMLREHLRAGDDLHVPQSSLDIVLSCKPKTQP